MGISGDNLAAARGLLYEREGGTCFYCGTPIEFGAFQVDHIMPASAGGSSDEANLAAVCKSCNQSKWCLLPEDWLVIKASKRWTIAEWTPEMSRSFDRDYASADSDKAAKLPRWSPDGPQRLKTKLPGKQKRWLRIEAERRGVDVDDLVQRAVLLLQRETVQQEAAAER